MNNFKKNSGITLVALIITIIILLILAVVTIMSVTGDGIISKSRQAKIEYEKGKQEEEGLLSGYLSKMDDISSQRENIDNKEIISENENYVGYYADVDADGTVDGVIYADLAIGNTGDGEWFNSNYTINKIDNVKDYYISQTNYSGDFGTKDVLCATGEGNDRFYVMALEDFNPGTYYCWYYAANGYMNDYSSKTSRDFGKGRQNTFNMIEKWNNREYGAQDDNETYKDVWGQIQSQVNDGWFVPSIYEWSAFGNELGITKNNYESKKLRGAYWSSSQSNETHACLAHFKINYMDSTNVYYFLYVRLSTTF